ncbi:MAG: hypothetical protein JWQ27_3182 [Ferruginibacter sp.]|nr:hypothetical protein [Ferruginibacter sp.]
MKYLLIALTLLACHSGNRKNATALPPDPLDTIQSSVPANLAEPAIFEAAFSKGTTKKVNDATVHFYGINIGNIKLPTGRVVACDPLHIDEYGKPFTQIFPTGAFPLQLSIIKVEAEESIAFARIKFSDSAVVKWSLALLAGEEDIPIEKEAIHGYGVDAGIGIFMDESMIKQLDLEKLRSMNAPLYQDMEKHRHYGWRYTLFNVGAQNMAAFTSGLGDGRYASYIGFDAAGKPCRLLTDFAVYYWKKN